MDELTKKTVAFQRRELEVLLAQLTGRQREFFNKIYPKGVPTAKLANAYDQCRRTILKNATTASPAQAGTTEEQ